MNLDELREQIERDELSDAQYLTPREYAKLRGMYPQKVYAAIRSRKLAVHICQCGRKTVKIEEADEAFNIKDGKIDAADV